MHNTQCTGCTACFAICPTNAISMEPDEEGFLFPVIDENCCINCHKCDDVCPLENPWKYEYQDYCYLATSANNEELAYCSSGGVFPILARYTLNKSGIICGCILDQDCTARHVVSDDPKVVRAMSKSKYVQSDMGDCYQQTKSLLDKGRFLLFSGTPCQVGGLMSYLGREYKNLLTMDFACHGVPSPLFFKKYVTNVKAKNPHVKSFWFRNKSRGWCQSVSMTWLDEDGNEIQRIANLEDSYLKEFIENNSLRKSCPQCHFCTPQRSSDFTVGDHWNMGKSPFYNPLGVSFILFNSQKALHWLKENEDEFQTLERISLKNVGQPHFWRPYFRGKNRKQIFTALAEGKICQ
nr:Coenzyme F420 hydrogenase/dehydrogenase, beta subunit C-terminal domain [Desulfovibrio sp. ZJ369]